ncbi:MAG: hypothetical protein LBC96_04495 [Lachnospiraceae bacterium]|jgi:hypothetical protein|nr:hypothetical protein [Lachnospiraceae bacterium]
MGKKAIDGQMSLLDLLEESKFIVDFPQFTECNDCWCYDCRYNSYNEAVLRDLAGEMKPCPSCNHCLSAGNAEVCEIGSYQNGCKLRATEEGITQ